MIRGIVAGVVAVAAGAVTNLTGQISGVGEDTATRDEQLIAFVGAGVLVLAGIASVRSFASAVRKGAEARDAAPRGAALAFVVSVAGYVLVALTALGVLEVNIQGLLLGGAVTGVVIGIAAQQTIGNFFAGIVLVAVRPFTVGESVVLRSGPLGGEYEGTVTDMSLFYVHMQTVNGPVSLPNAGVLAAAIGPGARAERPDQIEPDEEHPV